MKNTDKSLQSNALPPKDEILNSGISKEIPKIRKFRPGVFENFCLEEKWKDFCRILLKKQAEIHRHIDIGGIQGSC